MNDLKELIKQFMPFAQEQMGFDRPPRLFLRQDDENAANPLGKTGFYDPQAESITIYVAGRHPKDILRSLAHELMHHTQKCNGDFDNVESQGMGEQGYAQNNAHMRNMEIQAYQASIVFRDWEDSLKETIYYEHLQKGANKAMSTKEWKNGEIKTLLTEAWGFQMDLSKLNEDIGGSGGELTDKESEEEDYISKDEKEGNLSEDSGEEEGEHYEDSSMDDKDHIKAIEHHLDALKHDKDYDDEHIQESPSHPEDRPDRVAGRDSARRVKKNGQRVEETLTTEQLNQVAKRVLARLKERTNG